MAEQGKLSDKNVSGQMPKGLAEEKPVVQGLVTVHTANRLPMRLPLAGMKEKEARKHLKTIMNLSDDEVALVNGEKISGDTVLEEGVILEYVRDAGVKG